MTGISGPPLSGFRLVEQGEKDDGDSQTCGQYGISWCRNGRDDRHVRGARVRGHLECLAGRVVHRQGREDHPQGHEHRHGLSGTSIASITSISFSNCTGPLGLTFTVKAGHLPWHLNAVSYSNGVTHGTITGIHATLTGPSCSAKVDGTSGTANNGKVSATYTNSTGVLKILTTGGNLHIYSVSGCAGLIHSGDASTFSGSYTVSPKQKITSP
jgi:hypothetical protein